MEGLCLDGMGRQKRAGDGIFVGSSHPKDRVGSLTLPIVIHWKRATRPRPAPGCGRQLVTDIRVNHGTKSDKNGVLISAKCPSCPPALPAPPSTRN